jgi:hypothetical protein
MFNRSLIAEYSNILMTNPFVQYTDGLMGIWFDYYMNIWLQTYYFPSFIAGKEDEWKQIISNITMCKV